VISNGRWQVARPSAALLSYSIIQLKCSHVHLLRSLAPLLLPSTLKAILTHIGYPSGLFNNYYHDKFRLKKLKLRIRIGIIISNDFGMILSKLCHFTPNRFIAGKAGVVYFFQSFNEDAPYNQSTTKVVLVFSKAIQDAFN
jgi:hypothetical protein